MEKFKLGGAGKGCGTLYLQRGEKVTYSKRFKRQVNARNSKRAPSTLRSLRTTHMVCLLILLTKVAVRVALHYGP